MVVSPINTVSYTQDLGPWSYVKGLRRKIMDTLEPVD